MRIRSRVRGQRVRRNISKRNGVSSFFRLRQGQARAKKMH
jgi:hypothetical protein